MSTNEPQEPVSTEGAQPDDDERVDVLVEDLFIEEFPVLRQTNMERAAPTRHAKGRATRVILGLLALSAVGALALTAMLIAGSRPTFRSRVAQALRLA